MKKTFEPHDVAKQFFQSLLQNQCHVCWGMFTDRSQREFINWTLKDIYEQHAAAAKTAKLGMSEVKLMFETNNLDLIIRFWRRFVKQSAAVDFARFAYFRTVETQGKKATVEARLQYPNGQEIKILLIMLNERGGWKFGYLESDLRWN